MKSRLLIIAISLIGITVGATLANSTPASAASATNWRAGNIIDDSLFYDNSSMSVEAIQAFLNARTPNCDTQGTQSAADVGYPNLTHAQYAAMRGWPGPPYVCLKDYAQVPTSTEVISNFQGSMPDGAISAAQIIKNAADTYHVSPKALLVTLHKESLNLIYDNWPMLSQYKNSMGYGCPDTAPCDPRYEGFYNQMHNAARQFNLYRSYPSSYRYKPFQDNVIGYNPNANCGSSVVYVQNFATAGLYNYTPYQPNQAALNNLYGTGDGCSAYGNRNFWRTYTDWFGGGFTENNQLYVTSPMSVSRNPVVKGEPITLSYTVQNKSSANMDTGVLWICASLNGTSYGSGSTRKTLAPSESLTVSMTYTPASSGVLTATACGNTPNGTGFTNGYPNEIQYGYREKNFTVNPTGVTISAAITPKSPLYKDIPNVISYSVQNRGQQPVDTGDLWVCSSLNGKAIGGGGIRKVLAVNETLTVTFPYTPSTTGSIELTACGNPPGGPGWVSGYPIREYDDHGQIVRSVTTSPIVISSAVAATTPLMVGVPTTLYYQVQNRSAYNADTGILWICTSLNGKPFGSGATRKVLSPNETLLVSLPYTPSEKGTLEITACGNPPDGPGWISSYPSREYNDHAYRKYSVAKSPITISAAIAATSQLKVGVPTTLYYQVQNRSAYNADTGILWICTSLNGKPFGSGAVQKVLSPNETLLVSFIYTPSEQGILELTACGNPPGGPGWISGYPARDYEDHAQRKYTVSN